MTTLKKYLKKIVEDCSCVTDEIQVDMGIFLDIDGNLCVDNESMNRIKFTIYKNDK